MSRLHADPNTSIYKEKCNRILDISPNIRYVGITNKFGRTLAGSLRKGVVPLLRPEEAKSEYFIEASRTNMRRNFEKSIGKAEYTLTEHEKVKILTTSDSDNLYYITIEKSTPEAEVSKIIQSVTKLAQGQ